MDFATWSSETKKISGYFKYARMRCRTAAIENILTTSSKKKLDYGGHKNLSERAAQF